MNTNNVDKNKVFAAVGANLGFKTAFKATLGLLRGTICGNPNRFGYFWRSHIEYRVGRIFNVQINLDKEIICFQD